MKKNILLLEVILCTLGFSIFSYFIHYEFPLKIVSLTGLFLAAYIISRQIHTISDINKTFGIALLNGKQLVYILTGLILGFLYALYYRNISNMSLFPGSLKQFAIFAVLIGFFEELFFRGFIQGHTKKINITLSIIIGTLAHTAYKTCLFVSPAIDSEINIFFLIRLTLIGGLFFSLLKQFSGSVIPAALGHALFDILVYGELTEAPWWVW